MLYLNFVCFCYNFQVVIIWDEGIRRYMELIVKNRYKLFELEIFGVYELEGLEVGVIFNCNFKCDYCCVYNWDDG